MTQIDASQRLAAALRERAAALGQRSTTQRARGARPATASHDAAQLLVARLQALDPADPQKRRKAVRIYLESELAREFGAELLNDSAFSAMLDAIQLQMQGDAQIAAAVDALGDLLAGGKLP